MGKRRVKMGGRSVKVSRDNKLLISIHQSETIEEQSGKVTTKPMSFNCRCVIGQVVRGNGGIDYNLEKLLGAGRFGEVYRCVRSDAGQLAESVPHKVAVVKVQKCQVIWEKERTTMLHLLGMPKRRGEDKWSEEDNHNIVKLLGWFSIGDFYGLVMEHMDGDLLSLLRSQQPRQRFPLDIVSCVVRQLLTALDWMKEKRMIHADLKPNNVLYDLRENTGLRVKLADFGWAFHRWDVKKYLRRNNVQPAAYRAPEIHLGAPFSEAIDMWSLGIITGIMAFGIRCQLFAYYNPLDSLKVWSWVCGGVPIKVLDAGMHTGKFYNKTGHGEYTFKDEQSVSFLNRVSSIQTGLKNSLPLADNDFSRFFFGCLQLDPEIRLTPKEGLELPFVKMCYEDVYRNPKCVAE